MTVKKAYRAKVADAVGDVKTVDELETTLETVKVQDAGATASSFPIVGIGASAGGLAAFEAFFSGMPADINTGMAFVMVQHLAPDHKSILTELVRRYTRMQVFEVEDGMIVQPNCAYIIPPNRDMALLNGTLQLMEPSAPRGQRLPIDFFFRSLAEDQHERAICIVLSGTGSDGTQGVRAIKGEGGMAMAQIPTSTEYDGMPRSAIATGLVDYVLLPAEMPRQLMVYVGYTLTKPLPPATVTAPKVDNALMKIFILLRAQTSHDFSLYKLSTMQRRIERRMAIQQIESMDGYVKCLQHTPEEVEALFRDLLINVTSFFRDPEAFKALEEQAIPKLFANKSAGATIRTWVLGCSTGEEAYSIAILLVEALEAMKKNSAVQIFATDIDSQAIATARSGIYPASIAADLTPERLARFFSVEIDGSAYRVRKGLRDMLIFSEQSVIKDAPFSKLDLISCRNLLIYMSSELQKKIIPLFHYALNPGGILFLGTSETIGDFDYYFTALDRKSKLYLRREHTIDVQRAGLDQFDVPLPAIETAIPRVGGKVVRPVTLPLRELTERAILQQIAPVGALVNSQGDILYLYGHSGLYLEPTAGEARISNILMMAREGLQRELTIALRQATVSQEVVRCPGLRVKTNSDYTTVNLTISQVTPEAASMPDAPLFLVILQEAPPEVMVVQDKSPLAGDLPSDSEAAVAELKRQLRAKDEYLQVTNEELETSNEELKSSNEEMQSVNEELQSTNEELETSKEELQSLNEELATVNTELQTKVADLSRANNDMNNLLAGTGIGTIFLDHQLRILRFTPTITRIINLIQSDLGRSVSHIVSNLVGYDHLVTDVQSVLDTLIPKAVDVQTSDGKWYMMHILPYRTLENVIEGAVITFVEITEIVQARTALSKHNELQRLAIVAHDALDAIIVQDLDGHIQAWNLGAEKIYGWSKDEALAMNYRDLIVSNQRKEAWAEVHRLSRPDIMEPFSTLRVTKEGRTIELWLTVTALVNESGQLYAIGTTERLKLYGSSGRNTYNEEAP